MAKYSFEFKKKVVLEYINGSYRTKCVDENRFQALKIKGWRRFNLFSKNFEGGQNVLIKNALTLENKGQNRV